MNALFVAGTDTGVGKSTVVGLLAGELLASGRTVITQKWVQTGSGPFSEDIDIHLRLMKKRRSDYAGYLDSMAPYTFKFSASPHLAGQMEKVRIRIDRIKKDLKYLMGHFDFVIIEGSGGLLVPLNEKTLLIDVVRDLRLPVLLVAGNRLGAINHTLLSIEALKARHIKIIGVIFNSVSDDADERILKDNPEIVEAFAGVDVLGLLPYDDRINELSRKFNLSGKRVIGRLWKTG